MEIDVLQLLGSYAFPIVACVLMGWYIKYISDKNRDDTKELNKSHETIMLAFRDSMTEAINNNTLAINTLCNKLDLKIEERRNENEIN